jgi:50S ribosomal protein L16 3-hydroxylase
MRPHGDIDAPTPLLGGLSPRVFMRRHWQKKPLLVRQAVPDVRAPLGPRALFELAASEAVESRLVVQDAAASPAWRLRRGPLPRRALPPLSQPGWTLLVQGLDLHVEAAHALLSMFRFIPKARLDDLMLSWASDGGGVGPHVDSYDVFLLQVDGRRRWRAGPLVDAALRPDLPLKILAHFEPTDDWLLEPGDLLYLPPGWAHDGVAVGECMTASIGFRAPDRNGLASELLARLADREADCAASLLYSDASQSATAEPGRMPAALSRFAEAALARALREPRAVARALGEALTEPKPQVWFVAGTGFAIEEGLRLHPASRMLYDDAHVFINGESWRAAGRDARLLRRLADGGQLCAQELKGASAGARALLADWAASGWLLSPLPVNGPVAGGAHEGR